MAGEEAPGATSLCLILYLFTWPSPNIGSHTKDTVVQKSVYLPTGNWIIFRIHRHRIHACQGGSLLNSFRENPVLIFTVTVGDRPLLRLTSCGFTFEIQLTCSKLPRRWDWAGVFPGKPQQVQYFLDGLVCGQHFDGNYRAQEVIYSPLRRIVQNVSRNKSVWHHVTTSKLSKRKEEINSSVFLTKRSQVLDLRIGLKGFPVMDTRRKETERSNLKAMKTGFDLNKTLGTSACLYLVLHFFQKIISFGLEEISVIKSICWFCQRPKLGSQLPYRVT